MNRSFPLPMIILIVSLILNACSNGNHLNTQPDEKCNLPLSMNLQPAYDYGYFVTRVSVTISKGEFHASKDLTLEPPTAQGTFTELDPGLYSISVTVYQDSLIIATGIGQGNVLPGQDTTVNITLHMIPGNLTITVDWGTVIPGISKKILFVGNSHTFYNGGIDVHVNGMVDAIHPEWNVICDQYTVGGATLEQLLNDPSLTKQISAGAYDLVVLQENSSWPIDYPQSFYDSVTHFNHLILQAGAQTGLYMTQGWFDRPCMIDSVAYAYTYIGTELGALVCPAGLAWKYAMEVDSTLVLHDFDGSHPNPLGTYLTSCVIFSSIWHINPIGNTYISSHSFADEEKLFAQRIAWETVCSYFGWNQ